MSCGPESRPRPTGQLRIDLPAHTYAEAETRCPYTLEIPGYAHIRERSANDSLCWSDLVFPGQSATVHLTYKRLDGNLAQVLDEAIGLTYEHHIMADNIENETIVLPESQVYGTVSKVYGNVASHLQFYVTDSSEHFLRGALYFNAPPNMDSLAPVVDHLEKDLDHLLSSLRWKE
ncbi:MAG: gliding motility lipoprotein GldD [Flavobacteriales bacterium]|nr:gliding motility lipoprotein GldD [Flavobacteriales bacterium]